MAEGSIIFKLLADAAGFVSGVKNAKDEMKKLIDESGKKGFFEKLNTDVKNISGTFSKMASDIKSGDIFGALAGGSKLASMSLVELGAAALPIAALGATIVTVGAAAKGMWDNMSKANELKSLAEGSSMTVKELLGLEQAFSKVGIPLEEVPTLVGHFVDAIKELGDPASKITRDFSLIGLSFESFARKTPAEAINIFGEAVSKATNKTNALIAAQDAFSLRRGGRLMGMFQGDTLAQSRRQTLQDADIYDKMAMQMIAFQNGIGRLKLAMDSFFAGLNSKVIPIFASLVNSIERIDLTDFGRALGSALTPALKIFELLTQMSGSMLKSMIGDLQALLSMYNNTIGKLVGFLANAMEYSTGKTKIGEKDNYFSNLKQAQDDPNRLRTFSETIWDTMFKWTPTFTQKQKQEKEKAQPGAEPYTSENRQNEIPMTKLPMPFIAPIVDSLTKIGGGGGFGQNSVSDFYRDQLRAQNEQIGILRDIAVGVRKWGGTPSGVYEKAIPKMYNNAVLGY
jgi:hypothetical protein